MTVRDVDDTNRAPPGAPGTSGYVFVPSLNKFMPLGAVDNGDGTASVKMTGIAGVTSIVQQGSPGGTAWPVTDASLATVISDLGQILATLQATLAVSGTFWQATQPVSLATNAPDVVDRAARLLGHVAVDSMPATADQLVHGTVTANLGTVDGVALDATLSPVRNRFSPSLATGYPAVNPVNTTGDTVVYTPAAGKAIRLKWLYLATLDSNAANVVAKVRFSSQAVGASFYTVPLGKPGGFAHGTVRESVANDTLIVNLSAAQPVYLSFDIEEI